MTDLTPDYTLAPQTLAYTGEVVEWNLISELPLALVNAKPATEPNVSDTFHFMSARTCIFEVSLARGGGCVTIELAPNAFVDTIEVQSNCPTSDRNYVPPVGVTVKHVSKTGEGYTMFAWDQHCAMRNVSHDTIVSAEQEDYRSRDSNYTFEHIVHRHDDAATADALISMTSSYGSGGGKSARQFWRLEIPSTGVPKLTLTENLQQATWFTVTTTDNVTTITRGGGDERLRAPNTLGQPLYFADSSSPSIQLTQVPVTVPRKTPGRTASFGNNALDEQTKRDGARGFTTGC